MLPGTGPWTLRSPAYRGSSSEMVVDPLKLPVRCRHRTAPGVVSAAPEIYEYSSETLIDRDPVRPSISTHHSLGDTGDRDRAGLRGLHALPVRLRRARQRVCGDGQVSGSLLGPARRATARRARPAPGSAVPTSGRVLDDPAGLVAIAVVVDDLLGRARPRRRAHHPSGRPAHLAAAL